MAYNIKLYLKKVIYFSAMVTENQQWLLKNIKDYSVKEISALYNLDAI